MQGIVVSNKPIEDKHFELENQPHQYSSVEISNSSIAFSYQFKLWNTASMPMCILVKEDSDIISRLNVGDTLKTKYYASNPLYPPACRETAIRDISKNNQGRFKGHYLVSLEILEEQE